MKLVKFKDGTFGVRRGIFSYEYLDLMGDDVYWWPRHDDYFRYCKSDEITARAALERLADKGTPYRRVE